LKARRGGYVESLSIIELPKMIFSILHDFCYWGICRYQSAAGSYVERLSIMELPKMMFSIFYVL
jgi:hypothetical protein